MRIMYTWLVLALLLAGSGSATEPPPTTPSRPRTHKTACSLAESMASKLGGRGPMAHDAAQRSCEALAPTMSPADHAEFMRCCMKTLETDASAGKAPRKSPAAPNPPQSM